MCRLRSILTRVLVTLAVTLACFLLLWLPLLAYVHYVGLKEWNSIVATSWVTEPEIRKLMRYHGADTVRITQDRVYIWRDSRWIPVMKRT